MHDLGSQQTSTQSDAILSRIGDSSGGLASCVVDFGSITFCKDANGKPRELGKGAFSTVSRVVEAANRLGKGGGGGKDTRLHTRPSLALLSSES